MIGQGCPLKRFAAQARRVAFAARRIAMLCWCALILAMGWANGAIATDQGNRVSDGLGLRIVWGGGHPTTWIGSISVSEGEFTNLVPLGLETDDNVSIASAGSRLRIRQSTPGTYNGCDIQANTDFDAKLNFEFSSLENPSIHWSHQVALRDVIRGSSTFELDGQNNRIVVQRSPADELRIAFDQDRLIFSTNATTNLTVHPVATGFSPLSEGKLRIVARASSGETPLPVSEVPVKSDALGEILPIDPIAVQLPETEGVFEWEVTLIESQKRGPFISDREIHTRRVQFVTLAQVPAVDPANTTWQEAFAIDPTRPERWTMRRQMNQWKLPTRYPALLGNGVSIEQVDKQAMVQLGPKGWQAIPIPIDELNAPHVLEIEYLASRPLSLGLSLLEPNALGIVPNLGVDSGIAIPSSTVQGMSESEPLMETHRITFWPSSSMPYLILANHDQRRSAVFGRIRVLSGPRRLTSMARGSSNKAANSRQRLLFLERPTFAQALNAAHVIDVKQNQVLDDWTTIYTAADRLVQYLQANGYSGLAMSVAADGSAIYPSQRIQPTPRWDRGAYFSTGQDALRKDVLDLLFRMFERAGLTLVPIVELSGRLPGLENQRLDSGPAPFDLVDINGQVWGKDPSHRLRPPYNPLHAAVQSEFAQVIEEISARYAQYNSFAGVGLGVNGRCAVGFPDETWGWDDATVRDFATDEAIDQPIFQNASWGDARQRLLDQNRDLWHKWRAQRLTELFLRLQSAVVKNAPSGKLFVIPLDEATDVVPLRSIAEAIDASAKTRPLTQMGIDATALRQSAQVAVLDSIAVRQLESAGSVGLGNDSTNGTDAKPGPGVMFEHASSWAHFEQFEQQNPLGITTPIIRVQQLTPAGMWNRRRYASAMAQADCLFMIDGGSAMPLGQESATVQWAEALASLPNQSFETVYPKDRGNGAPLVVRQSRVAGQTYFYVINHSPWPVEAEIDFSGSALTSLRSLTSRSLTLPAPNNPARLSISLPPFEIISAVVDGRAEVLDFRTQLPAQSGVQMQREIQDLKAKLAQADPGQPKALLENPSFEAVAGEEVLTGWRTDANRGRISLDTAQAYDGASALAMRGEGSVVGIRSNYFAAPQTGRVSVSIWVRTDPAVQLPPLRMSLEATSADSNVNRFSDLGPPEGAGPTDQWTQQVAHFDHLPSDLREVRIGVDLMGPGVVWIDRVEIHDRWLDKSEVQSLKQLLNLASYKLQEQGDAVGCLRILESYWPRFVDDQFGLTPAGTLESARAPADPSNGTNRLK